MPREMWVAVGMVVAALLTLAGVIYAGRHNEPSAQAKAIEALGKENTRLNDRIDRLEEELRTCKQDMEEVVEVYQEKVDRLYVLLGRREDKGET